MLYKLKGKRLMLINVMLTMLIMILMLNVIYLF